MWGSRSGRVPRESLDALEHLPKEALCQIAFSKLEDPYSPYHGGKSRAQRHHVWVHCRRLFRLQQPYDAPGDRRSRSGDSAVHPGESAVHPRDPTQTLTLLRETRELIAREEAATRQLVQDNQAATREILLRMTEILGRIDERVR